MDGVQLPPGYSHFEEAVYFLPLSSQKLLVLILSTSEGWKAESNETNVENKVQMKIIFLCLELSPLKTYIKWTMIKVELFCSAELKDQLQDCNHYYYCCCFFWGGIHSIQGWTATARHGVTRKTKHKKIKTHRKSV